jgi:poly-gamma-glutamate capsule biosynthesis protein CapA/YwtB (metallophosphatase superfamily)
LLQKTRPAVRIRKSLQVPDIPVQLGKGIDMLTESRKGILRFLLSLLLLLTTGAPSPGKDSSTPPGEAGFTDKDSPQPTLQTPPGNEVTLTLFVCGDVMTGRGVDQVLPHPSDPRIHEPFVKNAKEYVTIAERANGSIHQPVDFSYIWADALEELDRMRPDLRIINLETSITTSDDYWPGKGINYRMHPKNIPCLTEAGIDFCSLANNHTLDWGYSGLAETMETLDRAKVRFSGAGLNLQEARKPAVIEVEGKGRVLLLSLCTTSSGVPSDWAAAENTPGVNLIPDFSDKTIRNLAEDVRQIKQAGDIQVVSIHWGGNWGYEIPKAHRSFAHKLIDEAGVDLVYGHSSHHVRPIEVYRDKLILYGCGDFINDYEGIGGYEDFRDDLVLMYFPRLNSETGRLIDLQMMPLQIKRLRLHRASRTDARWLRDILNRHSGQFGTQIGLNEDNSFYLK